MQEQLIAIGFLVSLQVVGGVVAGDGLRNLHEEQSWINRSQVIRGLIYAAFPWASWPARVAGPQLPEPSRVRHNVRCGPLRSTHPAILVRCPEFVGLV